MKILKRTSFALLGLILLILISATVIEKCRGTSFVTEHIYHSVGFVVFWCALTIAASTYILCNRFSLHISTFFLHLSLFVILVGAFITWLTGKQGTLHLRIGEEPISIYIDSKGSEQHLPFQVELEKFYIEYYPGTHAPMDFISHIIITDNDKKVIEKIAMNHIARFKNYRFYQSSYDSDTSGSRLSISYDPWGIGVTYTGYLILLLSMIGILINPKGSFRRLLKNPMLKRVSLGIVIFVIGILPSQATESEAPVLPRDISSEMGKLYVYYNNRICPFSTLAKEFTTKLYGSVDYRKYTPEQVLSGWLFYYDEWKQEKMIRIKSREARQLLGIEDRYAKLTDFNRAIQNYNLEKTNDRGVNEANEKFNLVAMLCTGSMLRIFPYKNNDTLYWASQVDNLPQSLSHEQEVFIKQSMNYVNELVAKRNYVELSHVLGKIKAYQKKTCGEKLPPDSRFNAELLYNHIGTSKTLAIILIVIGSIAFVYACRCFIQGNPYTPTMRRLLSAGLIISISYLTFSLTLRGYIIGHWPLSNGFETMQFMAWCALGLTLLFHRKFLLILPFGYLVSGLAMMVSMMGESNPQITPLMPVLSSPLLSIHVILVMTAYTLLAFVMFNGIAGLTVSRKHLDKAKQLQLISRILLYPAVFTLASGIFVGAIWANISWGRYWGWDPKEVWALITLLIYSLTLHSASLPWFKSPKFFHGFCITAFLCVLITYFGVNFLLGGMHSYA